MFKLVTVVLSVFCLCALPGSQAHAGRFTCKAAQNLARTAASDRDAVIVDPDDVKKECRFSINGEPAGSPPREALVGAVGLMRQGAPSAELFPKKNVEWLALLLLAASTEDKVDDKFRQELMTHAEALAKCFKALEANAPKDVPAFSNDRDLFCRAAAEGGGQFQFQGKYWVEMTSAVPHLVVGAMRSNGASYLFVPFGSFRGQR